MRLNGWRIHTTNISPMHVPSRIAPSVLSKAGTDGGGANGIVPTAVALESSKSMMRCEVPRTFLRSI